MFALEEAHVLHQRVDRNLQLAEHADSLLGVRHGEDLRRRYDHTPGERQLLTPRELHIAGSGRQIEDQIVEVTPQGVVENLLDDRHDHGATHDVRTGHVAHPAERHAQHVLQLEWQPGRFVIRHN